MQNSIFGLFDSLRVGIYEVTLHIREGVKDAYDIHIKLKSYKFEFLGELIV